MPEENPRDRSDARALAWLGLLFSADGAIPMRLLVGNAGVPSLHPSWTLAFVLLPGTYEMVVFTFLAQPLFAVAAIGYLLKVGDDPGNLPRSIWLAGEHRDDPRMRLDS